MLAQIDSRLTAALKDENFMRKLDEYPHKVKYARITSLTWDETPIEQIEGKVTGGTANLDGGSAVRRTCSLTLEAQAMDIHDYYWGLKTKFKLEIGLENVINPQYPDIIWFNQGIYVFTQFNSSVSPTGYTFSISGKDKMCLLDGSMGGSLPSSIDFGKEDIITYNYKYLENKYEPSYCWIPYEYTGKIENYNFVSYSADVGDVNRDKAISAKDITILRKYLAGGHGIEIDEEAADVNKDGTLNAKDVTVLRRFLAGGYGTIFDNQTSHIWKEIKRENNIVTYECQNHKELKEEAIGNNIPIIFTLDTKWLSKGKGTSEVEVNLRLSKDQNGNNAIAGCYLNLFFDNRELKLKSITKGQALSNLRFTMPGDFNVQPISLLWDGQEGDNSTGILLTFTFEVPNKIEKLYPIIITSLIGDIYDNDLNNLNFTINNGYISVGMSNVNSINYSDYKFKKVLYENSFGLNESATLESTVFQVIRERTPRENVSDGGYYYNINKFPYVFQKNDNDIDIDKPIYFCFDRDEIIKTESIPIKRIIKEAVHKYANEPYHNIILSNLDITGQELLEYRGSNPVYLFYNTNTHSYNNINFYDQLVQECDSEGNITYEKEGQTYNYPQIHFSDDKFIFKTFNYLEQAENDCTYFRLILPNGTFDTIIYQASQILYGETIGYREAPLTYAGELVANVGESLTSILDKIKNMFGEYEYFYNVDGQFVFQRKQTYLNNSWNTILSDTDDLKKKYVMPAVYAKPIQYQFVNNKLFTSMNNNPQLSNIKNDFAVWGTRKGISGIDIPIHFRIGIQSKPTDYINYNGIHYIYDKQFFKTFEAECDWAYNNYKIDNYGTDYSLTEYYNKYLKEYLKPTEDQGIIYVSDWRELIYQMAVDNMQHGQKDDFLYTIEKNNPIMHLGKTGYEQYYEDMLGFWRDVYDPAPLDNIKTSVHTWYENSADSVFTYTWIPYPPRTEEDKIVYTSKEDFEPDYDVNMNYQLCSYYRVAEAENSNQANFYYPTRKATSFNVEYEYVTRDNGYYCQSLQGAKAYLQLLNGKEITVLNSNGAPLFQKTNESIGTYVSETYVWKHTGDGTVWFLIKENGYHRVMVKQNGEYYHAYSYYLPVVLDEETRKNRNIFYTTAVKNGKPYLDKRDMYYDFPPNGELDSEDAFKWRRGTNSTITRIPHTSVVKSIEENKDYDAITNFNVAVTDSPELLNFWIELIDPNESSEFYNYKIENIGVRGKAINDSGIKAIYYKETPNVMFINKSYWNTLDTHKSGYTYIQIPDYYTKYFSISSQGKTAKDTIDELLYQFTGYNESITLTSVPIYHLPLNSLIQIADKTTDINGDYIVNRISLPLAYNGMMNINASRAIRRII